MNKLLQSSEQLRFQQNHGTQGHSTSQEHSYPKPSGLSEDKHNLKSQSFKLHLIRIAFNKIKTFNCQIVKLPVRIELYKM